MLARLLPLLLLSGAPLVPGKICDARDARDARQIGNCRATTAAAALPLFAFAPEGGTGLPSASTDFCTEYSSSMTGAFFCQRGDGTVLSGSQALTAVGSPTTRTSAVCPNGIDCTTAAAQVFNGSSQHYETANAASPAGDFTVCALFNGEDVAGNGSPINKDDLVTRVFFLTFVSDSSILLRVYKADGTSSVVTTGAASSKESTWVFGCGSYDFVADGSSVLTAYVNGTASAPVTTGVGPPTAASSKYNVGSQGVAAFFKGRIRTAFYTESVLSAPTIAAMARSVLADTPTGTAGEALTFSRASVRFCTNSAETAGSWLPVDRPCVSGLSATKGGLNMEGARTNLALRSIEFDHAGWTKFGITATADAAVAPDGTTTAEQLDILSAPLGTDQRLIYQGRLRTATAYSLSVWLRAASGTPTVYLMLSDGTDYHTQACPLTTAWSLCRLENKTLTVAGWNYEIGVDRNDPGGQTNPGDVTIYAWGAMDENAAFSSSTIRTAGTTVARDADQATFADPVGISNTAGCAAARFKVRKVGSFPEVLAWAAGASDTIVLQTFQTVVGNDGTNNTTLTDALINTANGVFVTYDWSAAGMQIKAPELALSGAVQASYDGDMIGAAGNFGVGNRGAAGSTLFGTVGDVRLDDAVGGCQ